MAQSLLGRIGQLVRANVNAMLDQAEDPEKMLDQMIRDFTANIAEAEQAVATTIGNLRLLEDDRAEDGRTAAEWEAKARAASARADELRRQGRAEEADRFDELARIALRRQLAYEDQLEEMDAQIVQQREFTAKLREGLDKLRRKREELVRRRDELVSRARMAQAKLNVQRAVKEVSVLDPTSELTRFEERIRQQEALARGLEEIAEPSLEEQFAALGESAREAEVEARFARLKAGTSG